MLSRARLHAKFKTRADQCYYVKILSRVEIMLNRAQLNVKFESRVT